MDIEIYNDVEEKKDVEKKDVEKKGFKWKKFFIIICTILLIISFVIIYSRYKATSGLKINEYKITDSSLPKEFHGIKLVQFSDVFFGNTVDIDYLKYIVSNINDLDPDIVVFTGDFININIDDSLVDEIISTLSSINPTIGKFSIKGDSDNILYNKIFEQSEFMILDDTFVNVYYISDEPIIISNQDNDYDSYSILLLHKPDEVDSLSNHFNLILSGHSLNGQINIPFVKNLFLRDGAKKYYDGYYNVNGSPLYVSSGIGTTNFKYRLFNKPSINMYRLTMY